jgi:hypothetical protein
MAGKYESGKVEKTGYSLYKNRKKPLQKGVIYALKNGIFPLFCSYYG